MHSSILTHGNKSKGGDPGQHSHEVEKVAGTALVIGREELV